MEILEVDPFAKGRTVKDQYEEAVNNEVTLDFFLFCCSEELGTSRSRAKAGDIPKGARWPELSAFNRSSEGEPGVELRERIQKMVSWYAEEYPQLVGKATLNYGVCTEISSVFSMIILDLELMVTTDFNFRSLEEFLEKESFVPEVLVQAFPNYGKKMSSFLVWLLNSLQKSGDIDLRSVPPTGRFLPILMNIQDRGFRRRPRGSAGGQALVNGGGKRSHHSRARGDESQAAQSFRRGDREGGRKTGLRKSSAGGKGPASRREESGKFRGPAARNRGREDDDHASKAPEAAAIKAVEDAAILLNSKPALKAVKLKPQNSFMRRLQHKKIADMGFRSVSVGEDRSRAVKILKG